MNTLDNNKKINHSKKNSHKQNFQTNKKTYGSKTARNTNRDLDNQLFFDLKEDRQKSTHGTSHSNYTAHRSDNDYNKKRSRHYERPVTNNTKKANASLNKNHSRKPTRKQRNRRKKRMRFIQRVVIILSLIVLLLLIYLIKSHKNIIHTIAPQIGYSKNIESILSQTTGAASVTKYYIYGTHYNLEGNIPADNKTVKNLSLVYMDENTGEIATKIAKSRLPLIVNNDSSGKIQFSLSTKINEGANLENVENGAYCILLQVDYMDGSSVYKSLEDASGEKDLTYYTITKNNSNQKINIQFEESKSNQAKYLEMNVKNTSLPSDVYDIAIDAGHGGTDTGAISGKYTEAEFTLAYAKALYKDLTKKGYKVKLTRDGSESSNTKMAYTMYDEDGRVNIANGSNAKFCFCLHLNSNEQKLTQGGVQVYTSYRGNTDFAKIIADNIVKKAHTSYSIMETDKTAKGVYQRAYTQKEIATSKTAAAKGNFRAYSITTDTDYLFMIRELGGIATNAYIDGRNLKYGKNQYYNSNKGVQCFLIELGYISINKDLNNILSNKSLYINAISTSLDEEMQALSKE